MNSTKETYSSSLSLFQAYCDQISLPKSECTPANQNFIADFATSMIGVLSSSTISNYLAGLRAWHLIHRVPWQINQNEIQLLMHAAECNNPIPKKPLHLPITTQFIQAIKPYINADNHLDTAIFACLTIGFYTTCQAGELTAKKLKEKFNPKNHITITSVTEEIDHKGNHVFSALLPSTKTQFTKGQTIHWAAQNNETDPVNALQTHILLNQPRFNSFLFEYKIRKTWVPLTKTKFIKRLAQLATIINMPHPRGHSIRIGSALKYLLRGIPFQMVMGMGWWSDPRSFKVYLWKHVLIFAPYLQSNPVLYQQFYQNTILSSTPTFTADTDLPTEQLLSADLQPSA